LPTFEVEGDVRVERKRVGERVGLDSVLLEHWRLRVDGLFRGLDEAREKSPLPEEPPNEPEVREWLLTVRRARFADEEST
jgi:hypothetical protein